MNFSRLIVSCMFLLSASRLVLAHDVVATGIVYNDFNANGIRDRGEEGVADVRVSNGDDIVLTNKDGKYELPIHGDAIIFVCKPAGWIYPLDELNLPKFFYIHKPNGSPDDNFDYKGSEPTGPLPNSVDFPLTRYEITEPLQAVLMGDPQPASIRDVQFYGRDVMSELVGVDAEFGATLGDIVGNRLDLFEPVNEMQALAGIPWHNIIGNHDINFKSDDDIHANETFHRVYGPADYAFQYAHVHFIALDNVVYHGKTKRGYHGGLNDRQLRFVENYLKTVPKDHRIVIGTHIPLTNGTSEADQPTEGLQRLMRLLSSFPHTASFSAHTHINAIYHLDEKFGYESEHEHGVHVHHNVGTASGTWWKGPLDSRGIPMTTMRDGTPNGYAIATFEGTDMELKWKSAHHEDDYQMNIYVDDSMTQEAASSAEVMVNVFNGHHSRKVEMRVRGKSEWVTMKHAHRPDPNYVEQQRLDETTPMEGTKRMNRPIPSTHIWVGQLPVSLPLGTHLLEVRAEDGYGKVFSDKRPFRITRALQQELAK